MKRIKTLETRNLCNSAKKADAANARLHASRRARQVAELLIRSAKTKKSKHINKYRLRRRYFSLTH